MSEEPVVTVQPVSTDERPFRKVADLYPGTSVWEIHVDYCREQDKNAQVMEKAVFDRLKGNIETDKRLESLPMGFIKMNPSGNWEFNIISGHHRIRAARMGNVTAVFVFVMDVELTQDEIVAKQLAHNALTGSSDKQILDDLYNSIKDVDQRIASGVQTIDLSKEKFKNVSIDDISVDFDFRSFRVVFLNSQMKKFDNVLKELSDKDEKVYVADGDKFEEFADTLRKLSKRDNIRNAASLISRMVEITQEYLKTKPVLPEKKAGALDNPHGKQ